MKQTTSFLCLSLLLVSLGSHGGVTLTEAFSTTTTAATTKNNVLILDHLNINHEKGRHDWVLGFYRDFLSCAIDPRKAENLDAQKGTLWMNIGANQLHLPQADEAQVLDGSMTLVYPDIEDLLKRYIQVDQSQVLKESKFSVQQTTGKELDVTDPWGTQFRVIEGDSSHRDSRGTQPGSTSLGYSMSDITIHTPMDCNLLGIQRFYEQVLGASCIEVDDEDCIQIAVGPLQTLSFRRNPSTTIDSHVDLRNTPKDDKDYDKVDSPCNFGPHVSMYVMDLPGAYARAAELGLTYVNRRFKRRAYNKEEAMKDCMFRCLDIVDPMNIEDGVILRLEHEVRSVVKPDGTKYKSCPFDEIPK